jgi:hypothetical protein
VIIIKVSKLVKDGSDDTEIVSEETLASLEAVAQELVGDGAIVEIETA